MVNPHTDKIIFCTVNADVAIPRTEEARVSLEISILNLANSSV